MIVDLLTVGQVAKIYGKPAWRIRRIVDSLNPDLPRAGLYRLVPRSMLSQIAVELHRQTEEAQRPCE